MNLPNKLTILRIILVPFFVVLFMTEFYIPSFFVFVVASLTDMLDGRIARSRNLVTNFGKIMDPLADKILVYSAFCLMIESGLVRGWMLIVILAREFAVSGMRTVAASEGIVIAAGLSGKIKTVIQMIAVPVLLIVPAFKGNPLYEYVFYIGEGLLWASIVMTVYSGIEYIYQNKSVFKM